MRRVLAAVAAVLAGLAAGALWTLLQSDRYRADARVLVHATNARIPAIEALAESSVVEANVAQTLRLSSPPRIRASAGKGSVLTVSTEAGSRERARQVDAEAVGILTQKVPQRFPAASVTLIDPAHVAEQTSPTTGRNFLLTGLAGLLVGLALAGAFSPPRRRQPATAAVDPRVERRLQARIDQVARRELALAQRAGQLAAREQDVGRREHELERRQEELAVAASRPSPSEGAVARREQELARHRQELERRESDLKQREAELEAAAAAPAPEPEPEPEPEPAPPPPVPAAPRGAWTLQALDALARQRAQAGASAEQQDEWTNYLFFLREHAAADGTLPPSFDQLVNDVFGPLPQRDG